MAKITVTIEGAQGAGKTRIGNVLRDALLDRGATAMTTDDRWRLYGIDIEIIEKQTEQK